eukprot:TRINITY_DN61946_c0_g1_i1.p1 TRINITY_DN61946_c0_g1~~TRINITY_DN61946_c0_g1_i1.p1  ORF type:complete len:387 (-),score=22.66 TRINITY_DN61946_c0_g1_i1:675-1835(-)
MTLGESGLLSYLNVQVPKEPCTSSESFAARSYEPSAKILRHSYTAEDYRRATHSDRRTESTDSRPSTPRQPSYHAEEATRYFGSKAKGRGQAGYSHLHDAGFAPYLDPNFDMASPYDNPDYCLTKLAQQRRRLERRGNTLSPRQVRGGCPTRAAVETHRFFPHGEQRAGKRLGDSPYRAIPNTGSPVQKPKQRAGGKGGVPKPKAPPLFSSDHLFGASFAATGPSSDQIPPTPPPLYISSRHSPRHEPSGDGGGGSMPQHSHGQGKRAQVSTMPTAVLSPPWADERHAVTPTASRQRHTQPRFSTPPPSGSRMPQTPPRILTYDDAPQSWYEGATRDGHDEQQLGEKEPKKFAQLHQPHLMHHGQLHWFGRDVPGGGDTGVFEPLC